MKKNFVLLTVLMLLSSLSVHAQLRSMVDLPNVYLTSKDVLHIPNQEGVGLDFGWGFGTHYLMIKPSVGIDVTANFGNKEILKTLLYNPYAKLEVGAGKWRSNGQRCAKTNSYAYTLMAKGGIKYNFGKRDANAEYTIGKIESFLDYYVALEFANFFIKDMRRNSEFYLSPGYSLKSENFFAEVGIRHFINTLASRR